MKRGFEHRLLPPYHVSKDVEKNDDSAPLTVPVEHTYEEEKGVYEPVAAETPRTPNDHNYINDGGSIAKVETPGESPSEIYGDMHGSEEEGDIAWQLPDYHTSDSIRLFD